MRTLHWMTWMIVPFLRERLRPLAKRWRPATGGSLKALSHLLGGLEVRVGVGGVLAEVETVDLFIVAGTQADQ